MTVGILSGFFASGALPAFYMIAGMQFKEKPSAQFLKKTASDFMKPYAFTGLALAIFFPIVYYIRTRWMPAVIRETPHWILSYVLGISTAQTYVFGYQVYECYVVWFLPTMFIGLNLLNLILKIERKPVRHCLVAASVLIGFVLAKADLVYFFIAQGMVVLGFCYMGYLGKQSGFFRRHKLPVWVWLGLIIGFVLQSGRNHFSIAYINSTGNFYDYFIASASAVLILLLAIRVANTKWDPPEWLVKIGVHSPWIICIHAVELLVFPWYRLPELLPYSNDVVFAIEMLLKVMIILPCCMIIKKIAKYRLKKKLERNSR